MTDKVYLHVGAPKSGTTYLQGLLAENRERLAAAGFLVVGRQRIELVHAGMAVREDPRLDDLPEQAAGAWERLVAEVEAWPGHSAVISYELLAGATQEQAARAIDSLGGREVHVVITTRDLAHSVPSAWQERLKFGLTTPLEAWVPPSADLVRSEWGWRTLDPAGVAARWGATLPPERVHLVPVPRSGPQDELWRRFAEACGCEDLDVAPGESRANTSLGAAAAEVLRQVNGHVEAPVSGGRELALWVRDTLAEGVLADLDHEPLTLTESQAAEADRLWARISPTLADSGYTVHGSLEEIAPQRPRGTLPQSTTTDRQLEIAVAAIWQLLLLLRQARSARPGSGSGSGRTKPAGAARRFHPRRLLRSSQDRALRRRIDSLADRVAEAQASLAESRQQQLRIGLLTDLATELLLPGGDRDDEALERAVKRYRRGIL